MIKAYALRSELKEGKPGDFAKVFQSGKQLSDSAPQLSVFELLRTREFIFVTILDGVGGIVTRGDLHKAPQLPDPRVNAPGFTAAPTKRAFNFLGFRGITIIKITHRESGSAQSMSKQDNEAKELAAKVAQLRIDIAPQSESEITVMRFKGDPGKTFPLTWSTEDSGNKDQGILTVATLTLGRREFKGYGFDRPNSIHQLEKELLCIGITVKAGEFA